MRFPSAVSLARQKQSLRGRRAYAHGHAIRCERRAQPGELAQTGDTDELLKACLVETDVERRPYRVMPACGDGQRMMETGRQNQEYARVTA